MGKHNLRLKLCHVVEKMDDSFLEKGVEKTSNIKCTVVADGTILAWGHNGVYSPSNSVLLGIYTSFISVVNTSQE